MSKKIISFSLYGHDPMYQIGAIRNLELQKKFYPGWICRFYVSQEIPQDIILQLHRGGAEVIKKQRISFLDGMFWRFLPAANPDVEVLIVRDADSRLGLREKRAVEAWLESGKGFHIMRDHPYHGTLILGGMWGCKTKAVPYLVPLIKKRWKNFEKKGDDQQFLAQRIYPRIRHDCLIHSEFIKYEGEASEDFPIKRQLNEFVGRPFPANDILSEEKSLNQYLSQPTQVLPMPKFVIGIKHKLLRKMEDIYLYWLRRNSWI